MSEPLKQDLESGRRLPKGGPHPRFPRRADGIQALGEWLSRYAVVSPIEANDGTRLTRSYSLGEFTPVEWTITWAGSRVVAAEYPDWWR